MADTAPTRLDRRHVENHAHRAITERLGYHAPQAVIAVERDGNALLLRLNSGGNALAVEPYLCRRGYRAEYAGKNPSGYGCTVRVTLRPAVRRDDGTPAAKGER